MDNRVFRLRVTYGKCGRLAMLSHLEVTHALERIVRRAKLPFALSQGFSPHMKIAFGSALPVGVGGLHEVFDIQLTDYIAPAKVLERLQAAAPEFLMPESCVYIEPKAPAASVAYPYSLYDAAFACPVVGLDYPAQIEVVRKKKQKTLVVADFLVGLPSLEGEHVIFQLKSGDTGSLRPDVFLDSCEIALAHPCDSDSRAQGSLMSLTRLEQGSTPLVAG